MPSLSSSSSPPWWLSLPGSSSSDGVSPASASSVTLVLALALVPDAMPESTGEGHGTPHDLVEQLQLGGDRAAVREASVDAALALLLSVLG